MKFLEKDLEEIIYTADKLDLANRGLPIWGTLRRQVRLGNYGIADLIMFDRLSDFSGEKAVFKVFELKQDKISVSAFLQAVGYVKGLIAYLKAKKYHNILNRSRIEIHLIGGSIDFHGSFIYLTDLIVSDNITLHYHTYEYTLTGLQFKPQRGYSLVDHGFRIKK